MRVLFFIFGSTIGLNLLGSAAAQNRVYRIVPATLPAAPVFSGESTVSGTITTNGTIGELTADDILDYNIILDGGKWPYTFTPSNPGAAVRIDAVPEVIVTASPYELSLSVVQDLPGGRPGTAFVFSADDAFSGLCSDCVMHVSWSVSAPPALPFRPVWYQLAYFRSGLPTATTQGFSQTIDDVPPFVIARIPEPTTGALMLIGVVSIAIMGRMMSKHSDCL